MHLPRLALLLLAACSPAHATEIPNRDGAALIRAMQEAARSPEPRRILLHPGGLYTLSSTDSNGLALPPIRGRLTIEGRGAEIRSWTHRPMHFIDVQPGGEAVLRDLTLAEASDGAIRNHGRLRLERVVISDSRARGDAPILWNRGEMLLQDSRIDHNLVHAPAGRASLLRNEGVLSLQNSRLHGNRISHTQQWPLNAAALWNRGALRAEAVSLSDNEVNTLIGAAELPALVNVEGGQLSGELMMR